MESFKRSGADCIVTIGGGSSMDTAKAIGIIIDNPGIRRRPLARGRRADEEARGLYDRRPHDGGYGGEVTINYVITDVEKKRKFVCVDTNDIRNRGR